MSAYGVLSLKNEKISGNEGNPPPIRFTLPLGMWRDNRLQQHAGSILNRSLQVTEHSGADTATESQESAP